MASDDALPTPVDEDETHHHHSHHNLSRLSMCTTKRGGTAIHNNEYCSDHDEDDYYGDDDADGELYDKGLNAGGSSDSDKEPAECLSLPATPPRQRRRRGCVGQLDIGAKEYASENEARKGVARKRRNSRRSSVLRERWMERAWEKKNSTGRIYAEDNHSGESECLVITRPKGGRRSLCMDLEEVKACRDLGFELGRISMSCSTVDTSSGGNSPIANWRISSPGDDPRDVKARLKVWAQAVALATATR